MDEQLLIPSEAAKILGISVRRVQQLVDSGRLPATRAGGIRLITRENVEVERRRRVEEERDARRQKSKATPRERKAS